MTTLNDLDRIIPEMIRKMEDIASAMSRYKKIKTDGRARVHINEINGTIKRLKSVHQVFKNSPGFQTQNFDDFVSMYTKKIEEFEKIYNIIMEYESVPEYH